MQHRKLFLFTLAALVSSSLALSCVFVSAKGDGEHRHRAHGKTAASSNDVAYAIIQGKSGSALGGKATFKSVKGGVLVMIEVNHAPPGWHAVHVHEVGDCSSEDGKSAGGHFNPGAVAHGAPHAMEHHAGDLGNMWVDESGDGHHAILMPELTVAPGEYSVAGRAIIVHASADDLVSQPTGAAGGRIGCGEIAVD